MKEFFDFCRQNLVLIVSIATLLSEVIFVIIKRRPKTIDDFMFALSEVRTKISSIVSYVEVPGNGEEKKSKALDLACDLLSKFIGRSLTDKEKSYAVKFFDNDIENVLSAPSKKEKENEK